LLHDRPALAEGITDAIDREPEFSAVNCFVQGLGEVCDQILGRPAGFQSCRAIQINSADFFEAPVVSAMRGIVTLCR